VIAKDCDLTLVFCWVEAIYGEPKRVDELLALAQNYIEYQEKDSTLLQAEYETVRSQAYFSMGDFPKTEKAARKALELFPANNTRRQSALLTYANVKFEQGELDRALSIYEESELLSRQEANHDAVLWSLNQQAQIWKQRCEFGKSTALAKEVQEYALHHNVNSGYNACFSLFSQAELALEAYHLREARLIINDVGIYVQNWDEFWGQHLFGWLLKMEMLKGKPTVARDFSTQHEGILARENVAEHLIPYSMEVQLMYWWQNEEIKKIETWLKATPPIHKPDSVRDYVVLRAQLYGHIACQRYGEAMMRIEKVYEPLREFEGRPYQLEFIRLGLLLVALLSIQGKKQEATNELSLLLPLIQQYSIVASILYLRQWVMPLFEDMELSELPEEQAKFVEQLLILYKQRNTSSRRGEEEVPDGLLALGISKKEWRVLQYIMEGKSNDDIAQTMFIAVSTVKTHINNLYKKLSVANRKEAIVLGKELTS
jgi:ATP/maltotriose-dependent transcriptional regulator MalT